TQTSAPPACSRPSRFPPGARLRPRGRRSPFRAPPLPLAIVIRLLAGYRLRPSVRAGSAANGTGHDRGRAGASGTRPSGARCDPGPRLAPRRRRAPLLRFSGRTMTTLNAAILGLVPLLTLTQAADDSLRG